MARIAKIVLAKTKIEKFLDATGKHVFSQATLNGILTKKAKQWDLSSGMNTTKFISFLIDNSHLKEVIIAGLIRYLWRSDETENIVYEIALSLKPRSYLSHYTAMFFHNMTEQVPKTIYVTYDRGGGAPARKSSLSQESIDIAFQKPERITRSVYDYEGNTIVLIESSRAGHIGVNSFQFEDGMTLPMTNVERTLMDITVRPAYAGGILAVVGAYQQMVKTVQVVKLRAYLKQMGYTYPYEQAIGFCLEYAGAMEKQLKIIDELCKKEYRFYLARKMSSPKFSERWQMYYPESLG